MTTPERFRRRQLIEGTLLMILGLWVAFWTWNGANTDREIIHCLETKVDELSAAAGERSDLNTEESKAIKKVILAVRDAESGERVDELIDEYEETITQINLNRKNNPLPPFPEGVCEEG